MKTLNEWYEQEDSERLRKSEREQVEGVESSVHTACSKITCIHRPRRSRMHANISFDVWKRPTFIGTCSRTFWAAKTAQISYPPSAPFANVRRLQLCARMRARWILGFRWRMSLNSWCNLNEPASLLTWSAWLIIVRWRSLIISSRCSDVGD